MIAFVKGEVEYIGADILVINVGGIGYNVFISGKILNNMPSIGEEIKLFTYLNVREDAMQLFGFADRDELNVFKLLITVNGIGPKGALSILSCMTADDLRFAVAADDAKTIAKSPGIGAKTASKLILELKDKLKLEDAISNTLDTGVDVTYTSESNDIRQEAIMALTALGYTHSEACKAVKSVDTSQCITSEDVIKKALRALV
ncbi:MAG: Holliday junction branch migration protein RuvA [Lachnospiraceae bacterium]|nr:Holliday junction branch migration protein RuvA [Lachnospiraceae bacterium]